MRLRPDSTIDGTLGADPVAYSAARMQQTGVVSAVAVAIALTLVAGFARRWRRVFGAARDRYQSVQVYGPTRIACATPACSLAPTPRAGNACRGCRPSRRTRRWPTATAAAARAGLSCTLSFDNRRASPSLRRRRRTAAAPGRRREACRRPRGGGAGRRGVRARCTHRGGRRVRHAADAGLRDRLDRGQAASGRDRQAHGRADPARDRRLPGRARAGASTPS